MKQIPKATSNNNPSGLKKNTQNDTSVYLGVLKDKDSGEINNNDMKPKKQIVQDLGFSQKQLELFKA